MDLSKTIDHPLSPSLSSSSSLLLTSPLSSHHPTPPPAPSTTSSPRQGMEAEPLGSPPRRNLSSSLSSSQLALGNLLTNHTSFYDIPITDAFTELMERYVPVDQRPERHAQQQQQQPLVNVDEQDELATMVMNHHWRAVARWARQKLVQTPPQDLDTILQLWHVRLLALFQLGLYQLASAEFEKLSDVILTVPFAMQVLWALLPFQLDHPLVTLERLSLLAVRQQGGQRELQLGDLETAGHLYTDVETLQKQHALASPLVQETIQTNRAFLCMAKGEWNSAKTILDQVVQQNPENLTAVNNLAVCLVYTGQVSDAMRLLETTTQQHPTTAGTSEPTLMNLCTLYELRFDGAALTTQKVNVVKQVARWVGDAFHPHCIKLP
ncbi:hypothetical protein [Absidia glauca]|uniref:Uncharacterized protein n=1 Tax=Absidia glauca TaxID=4829 RepID=A0A163JXY2_ABSGL|nr:hypothetical protein [Absidia glauca]